MGANVPAGEGLRPTGQDDTGRGDIVDVVVVGAGVIGIYQLYLAREAGYSVQMIEAGSGVGGTWYWNRYPGARYDSESYTYAYLFSEELFQEWEWTEHFSGQAENERYFNHVVDKFDLRRHIRFNTRVTSAVWDESTATYLVRADGYAVRARFLVAATGVLSVPVYPDVPGRERFRGEAYHTGLWPKTPVDFAGKRVAVIGTGSSGVQIIPMIAGEVASLTVYQRTPNWATPLNNRPITPQEQAELRANFRAMRETLQKAMTGFLHVHSTKKTFDDPPEERLRQYEKAWAATGFGTMIINYSDMMLDPAANAEWVRFVEKKIRAIVRDPATADKLIPTDHAYGGKRPPFVTDYYQVYNRPNVSLVDLKETPITAVTETGIAVSSQGGSAGLREFDIIVWATGFDFGTGALKRLGVRGAGGLPLAEYWADGPLTYLGIMSHHFPNFFYPAGPHGAAGNNPRYGGDQVDFVAGLIDYAREHGYQRIEVPARLEKDWTDMVNTEAVRRSSFTESSYFYGANIPGKARRFLLNPLGRPKLLELMEAAIKNNYAGFFPGQESAGNADEPSESEGTAG